jgi:hypothetical protein
LARDKGTPCPPPRASCRAHPPVIEETPEKKEAAPHHVLPCQESEERRAIACAVQVPQVGHRRHEEQHRSDDEADRGEIHQLQGPHGRCLCGLQHVHAGAQRKQRAAEDEQTGTGDDQADRRQEEHTPQEEGQGSHHIGHGRNRLEDITRVSRRLGLPVANDLGHVVTGHDEVEQRPGEEDPRAHVPVIAEDGEEEDAAHHETDPANVVENGVCFLPHCLRHLLMFFIEKAQETPTVSEQMRHDDESRWRIGV